MFTAIKYCIYYNCIFFVIIACLHASNINYISIRSATGERSVTWCTRLDLPIEDAITLEAEQLYELGARHRALKADCATHPGFRVLIIERVEIEDIIARCVGITYNSPRVVNHSNGHKMVVSERSYCGVYAGYLKKMLDDDRLMDILSTSTQKPFFKTSATYSCR